MSNRPQRLPNFSYVGKFRYFLTVCVHLRASVFKNDVPARIVIELFLQFAAEEQFEVLAYCVMPDHFHAFVEGLSDGSDLNRLMQRFKQKTGVWWKQQRHAESLWQRGFHDRVLREHDVIEGVVRYVVLNPVRARLVEDARDHPYIGASRYTVATLVESTCLWSPHWK